MKKKDSDSNKKAVIQLQQKPAKSEFLIVGIGASAGGVQALNAGYCFGNISCGIAVAAWFFTNHISSAPGTGPFGNWGAVMTNPKVSIEM